MKDILLGLNLITLDTTTFFQNAVAVPRQISPVLGWFWVHGVLSDLGVKKIRLTGGEPLVRKDIMKLINKLNLKLDNTNLKEITLTTNGTLLSNFAKSLKDNGVNRINISLDTLIEKKFNKITRFGNLKKVLNGISEAQKNEIKIKINTVAIKNFNEDEFINLIEWSNNRNIDLTFIEVMPMDETGLDRHLQFVALDKVFKNLNKEYNFYKIDKNTGGPSVYYKSKKLGSYYELYFTS